MNPDPVFLILFAIVIVGHILISIIGEVNRPGVNPKYCQALYTHPKYNPPWAELFWYERVSWSVLIAVDAGLVAGFFAKAWMLG